MPIYQILLSLYVKPSAPHEPDWESAISLLSKYGARIAASTTIDLLPEAVTIADVKSYFEGYVRSVGAGHKLERMTGALLGVEKVLWDEALVRKSPGSQRTDAGEHLEGHGTKTRRILLDEDRRCMVCHKKFGGSAIKVFPDNTVIHYGCVK